MTDPGFLTLWSYFTFIVYVTVTVISILVFANRFDSGFHQLLMHKGGNKYGYAFSLFLSDLLVHVTVMTI